MSSEGLVWLGHIVAVFDRNLLLAQMELLLIAKRMMRCQKCSFGVSFNKL